MLRIKIKPCIELQAGFAFQILISIFVARGSFVRAVGGQLGDAQRAIATGYVEFQVYLLAQLGSEAKAP